MAKRNFLVLAVYLVLALGLTYPLALQFGDHVPGTTTWSMDEYGYVWNNWWFKHAVFDLGTNPFHTDFLFYPIGTSLVLYTFTLLHVLLGLPVQLLFGLITASNVELIFAFVMSGFGTFLLLTYLLRTTGPGRRLADSSKVGLPYPELAAFAAGAIFAFSSNRFVYASLGHYNVVATEWIPFYLLFLVKTVREARWSNALLAGLFAAFALYVETTDGVLLFLFSFIFLFLAWRRRTANGAALLGRLVLMTATAVLLFAPLLLPTLSEIANSGYALPGWGHAEKLLVDLFGFFTPTSLQPLNRSWVQELDRVRQGTSRFIDVNTVFVGYLTAGLALLGAVRYWRNLQAWVITAISFAVLSLGPLLHINGQSTFDLDGLQVTFPLPFLLLHYIPILKENRVPNRFSVLVMLSMAVLVGFGAAWLLEKIGSRRSTSVLLPIFGILMAGILFEHASVPLPLTDARVPEIYQQIAREPGDFAVLTLPVGWRNSFGQQGAEDTRIQYFQSAHQKFIFPGNIQRNPPFLFDYFDRISLFHSLTLLETYQAVPDDAVARDRIEASALLSFLNVRYIVIHPSIPGRPPYSDTRGAVVEYIEKVLPLGEKVYDREGVVAYRVNQTPLPSRLQVDFGTDASHWYQAEGWDRDETIAGETANWANRQEARFLLPVQDVQDLKFSARILPFAQGQSPVQAMEVCVNGDPVQRFDLRANWENYTVMITKSVLHSGINDVVFKFSNLVRPRDVLPANFEIGTTGVKSPVDIVVNSATLGSIRVNGRESSLLGRGYNVVVIDPNSGKVTEARVFNTADDRSQSRALTDYLAEIPNGWIVAVAAQEEVAASLGDRTVAGLGSLGARVDIRENPSRSHAIIGVKGAPASSAIEESKEGTSFISVGHSPDERTLAAAVSTITVEKK